MIVGLGELISAEVEPKLFEAKNNSASSGFFQLIKDNIEIKSVIVYQITIS